MKRLSPSFGGAARFIPRNIEKVGEIILFRIFVQMPPTEPSRRHFPYVLRKQAKLSELQLCGTAAIGSHVQSVIRVSRRVREGIRFG